MKKTHHYTSWRITDDKKLCGIDFGYDFCTEHESGIAKIRSAFGINAQVDNKLIESFKKLFSSRKTILGIDARKITQTPDSLLFRQKGDFCIIYYSETQLFSDSIINKGIEYLSWEMQKPSGLDVITMWSDSGFMIVTTNQEHFQAIKKGFNDLNIAIFRYGKGGLVICFPDILDDLTKKELYDSDMNALELKTAMLKCGIEKRLKSAKKEYFALSPDWLNSDKKELQFWLNPKDQINYNYGWFTEQDLVLWIKEKGPIVKIKSTGPSDLSFKETYTF